MQSWALAAARYAATTATGEAEKGGTALGAGVRVEQLDTRSTDTASVAHVFRLRVSEYADAGMRAASHLFAPSAITLSRCGAARANSCVLPAGQMLEGT